MTSKISADEQKKSGNVEVSRQKKIKGRVVSAKMNKTVSVEVERVFMHPIFKKVVKSRKKYKAHDENSMCRVGDYVFMRETAPISKTKHMIIESVIKNG